MIQILVFLELIFCLVWRFGVPKSKNETWWDVYFLMLIFWLFFILADKISRSAKFWAPIQNLNSVAAWEIPHLNWRYDFVRFLRNFCQNAWTSSLCAHLKNDAFWISTVVLWTRKTKVSLHNINSWISSILEIPACIFSPMNSCNVNFMWIISFHVFLRSKRAFIKPFKKHDFLQLKDQSDF